MYSDFSQKQIPTIRSLGYIPPLITDPNLDPTKSNCLAIGEGVCGWIRNPALDEENKEDDQQQKEIPQEIDSAAFDCTGNNQYAGFPPLGSQPIYGSTSPYADNMNQIIGYTDPSAIATPVAQMCGGGGGGNQSSPQYTAGGGGDFETGFRQDGDRCGGNMRPYIPCNPNSTCYYKDVCSPLSDGQGICTPNYQIPDDYEDRMANRDCSSQITPVFSIDPRESLPVSEGGFVSDEEYLQNEPTMFSDDLSAISEEEINPCAGVRCIKLYKPCPEGYIDGDECCPNTGNCIPDPDYVIPNVGLVQMQPIGDPTTYRSKTNLPTAGSSESPTYRSKTNLPTAGSSESQYTLLDTPSTTETSTAEEPKQGGLGILVLGLIALEALAT